ncbi:MAG: glycosyltransferase family 4 protein [Anaerolineae bacterium]
MRIAIDYTAAARQGGGIGRYARELIRTILASSSQHDFVLMTATAGLGSRWKSERDLLREIAAAPHRLSLRSLPITDDWMARLWQRLRLPIPADIITGKVDCFYSPDFVLPPLRKATPALLTVHDLSFLHYPDTFTRPLRHYLEQAVPRSVRRADHVLADSDATRQDLIELLNVPAEKVTTLYAGVSPDFTPKEIPGERHRLPHRYEVGNRPFILAVGTVQPRKNYIRLMEACDPLADERNIDLAIVGRPAWLSGPTLEAASHRPYVHLLGFTDEGDLPALYRQAALLAFPSLYEGFGLPPLEAMASGTPVVASNASSIPEVVGEAGLLVDPTDVPAWTETLRRALDDEALRAQLRARGLERASQFTWERTAQGWWEVVKKG